MSDTIDIWNAPAIPGLVFRRLRGEADLPALVAVHAGREAHDRIDPRSPNQRTPTVEELESLFLRNPMFDADSQVLIAEVAGQIVGYAWIRTWRSGDHEWMAQHAELLLPEWRGKGIGKALLGWAEDVLAYGAQQLPKGDTVLYQTDVMSTEREALDRLKAAGYHLHNAAVVMHLESLDNLPPMEMPEGLYFYMHSRNKTIDAYLLLEMIFADSDMTASLDPRSFLTLRMREYLDPTLWFIVEDANENMVGVVLCEMHGDVGVIVELGVKQAWRGRGAGRALLVTGLTALRDRGATHAILYTNARESNIALKLYESVGFRIKQHIREYVKPVE